MPTSAAFKAGASEIAQTSHPVNGRARPHAQHGRGRPDLGRNPKVEKACPVAMCLPVGSDFGHFAAALLARRGDVFLLVADAHHADENLQAIKIFGAITVQTGWQTGS